MTILIAWWYGPGQAWGSCLPFAPLRCVYEPDHIAGAWAVTEFTLQDVLCELDQEALERLKAAQSIVN
jgi:hypothetical protein